MSTSDGQPANATTFNNAYVSKTADSTVTGTITLNDGDSTQVDDAQQAINDNISDISTNASNISTNTSNISTHVSSTSVHGLSGDVVGTTDTQVLTNKDIDGGTASDTNRITLPSDTKANLDLLTRKEGTIVYATDEDRIYLDDGTTLLEGGDTDHGDLAGLSGDDHSQYALLTGRSGDSLAIDTITEQTADNGVNVDSVNLKDGNITGTGTIYAGGSTIDGSAALQVDSTTKGALLCSMTETQRDAISTPATGLLIFNSTTSTYNYYDGSTWQEVGSGSGTGGINYIDNPDAESNTTGWSTYNDSSATPVDGTGGTVNYVTWTTTATDPLRGTQSFQYSKDDSDSQGEGVSYDFTIDRADKVNGRPVYVSFDYEVVEGLVTGDLTYHIYDVTNSELITLTQSASNGKFIGHFFPASDSSSYRFIIHTASTSNFVITVNYDNFKAGPSALLNLEKKYNLRAQITGGSQSISSTDATDIIFDTVSLGPSNDFNTSTGVWTSPYDGVALINTQIRVNDVGSGEIKINLLEDGSLIERSIYNPSLTSINTCFLSVLLEVTAGSAYKIQVDSSADSSYSLQNDDCWFQVTYTNITSSTDFISTQETLNVNPTAKIYRATNQTISSTSDTLVEIDTASFDDQDLYDSSNNSIVIPSSGKYKIKASITWANLTADESLTLKIYKNGSSFISRASESSNTDYNKYIIETDELSKGDYLQLYVSSTADTNYSIIGGEYFSYLEIEKIPDFTVYGVSGSYEVVSATSSAFNLSTAGYASLGFANMTGNNLTLSAGTWELNGALLSTQGTGTINWVGSTWSTENGDNSTSFPTGLSNVVAGYSSINYYNMSSAGQTNVPVSSVIINLTEEDDVYLVPRSSFSTAGNATMTVYLYARRLK